MKDAFLKKIEELISEAPRVMTSHSEWRSLVRDDGLAQAWRTSAMHAAGALCPHNSAYVQEITKLGSKESPRGQTEVRDIQRMLGILQAIRADANAGLLRTIEEVAFATAFDDFLDHAFEFNRGKKHKEAAILGAVVLEDAMKRIAMKHGAPSGQTLDPLIDALVKLGVFTSIKAKRLKAYAGVRNAALHAEWDKIDPKDVDEMLRGVRDLLDEHLAN